jgi:hypothetical protein
MAETIEIQPLKVRTVPVRVHGRVLEMRPPSMAADRELTWRSRRPGWYGAGEAVDRFLARCAENASLLEIKELGGQDRRRLMLALVHARDCEADWRRLYGSPLTVDERFFAVMIWAREREAKRLQDRLIELRENIIRSNGDQLRQIAETARATVFGKSKPFAAMALFEDRFKPFSTIVDHQLRSTRRLEQLFGRDWVNPLAKAALGLETPTAVKAFDFGLKSKMEELASGPLGTTRGLLGDKARADFRGLLSPTSRPGIADVGIPYARSATSAALRAFQDMYEPQPVSGIVNSLAGSQLKSLLEHPRPAIDGWDMDRFMALPGMPLFDGRLQMLLEPKGFSHLLPSLGIRPADLVGRAPPDFLGQFDRVTRSLAAAAKFAAAWGDDPFWFLLSILSPRQTLILVELEREQVYEATFDALEHAVRDTELVDALNGAIGEVDYLTDEQRKWLLHGLEHAKAGDWIQAVLPLLVGLDGAIHGAAVEAKVIKARTKGKHINANKVIRIIDVPQDFKAFVGKLIFGEEGHAFRHGQPRSDPRKHSLLLVVAVIGWLDHALGTQGTYVLAEEMREPLSIAARSYDDKDSLAAA